ncbi:hypothetical protein L873DRAFT_1797739 [Choiromyces venosus 120613-1]|uniref:Uncharacterized protein n=1 Tax=Choiromyces venosus 120613-1 TaxID=1336337 RepID=A0A3N4K492_9PEZI|nr:hypothetical protein L873DRAFT_1797739 [Choiromyces venosus 120613-1]
MDRIQSEYYIDERFGLKDTPDSEAEGDLMDFYDNGGDEDEGFGDDEEFNDDIDEGWTREPGTWDDDDGFFRYDDKHFA